MLKSGTRKEELITPKEHLQKTYVLRRILNPMGAQDAIEFLLDKLRQLEEQRRLLPVDEHVTLGESERVASGDACAAGGRALQPPW